MGIDWILWDKKYSMSSDCYSLNLGSNLSLDTTSSSWSSIISIDFPIFHSSKLYFKFHFKHFPATKNRATILINRLKYSSSTNFPVNELGTEQPRPHTGDSLNSKILQNPFSKDLGACQKIWRRYL